MIHNIGFIGLGNMGKPMVSNLLRSGYSVDICIHHRKKPGDDLTNEGAVLQESPRGVVSSSDIVILCLPDPQSVLDLIFSTEGLLDEIVPGMIIVDTGTTGINVTKTCSKKVSDLGATWIDAPMSGGVWGAQSGSLTFMVGGDKSKFEEVRPLLETMGKLVIHVGTTGAGQVTKLINNLMACINTVAVSEAFALGVRAGVRVEDLYEVVSHSSGSNWVLENSAPRTIFLGNYQPGGRLQTMMKDLNLVDELAKEYQAPLFLGSIVSQLHKTMIMRGYGGDDAGILARFYEEILDVSLVSDAFISKEKG